MATRRYSRTVLSDGSMIIKSEVDTMRGLTFQFQLNTGIRPSLMAFSVESTSHPMLLSELAHFLNKATRIINGDTLAEHFEDNCIF